MKEPRKYENNVHFWLRKIVYFVLSADVAEVEVKTKKKEEKLVKRPLSGEAEVDLRKRLKKKGLLGTYKPEKITKKEVEEACRKLYEMFNMPLDVDVLDFMEKRKCAGGWPRSM